MYSALFASDIRLALSVQSFVAKRLECEAAIAAIDEVFGLKVRARMSPAEEKKRWSDWVRANPENRQVELSAAEVLQFVPYLDLMHEAVVAVRREYAGMNSKLSLHGKVDQHSQEMRDEYAEALTLVEQLSASCLKTVH